MNTMTYKGYSARIEFDAEDMLLYGAIAGISDDVIFSADSAAQLEKEFHAAVDDYLDYCAKLGRAPKKPASGQMMLRLPAALHADCLECAQLAGSSLNTWAREVLAHGVAQQRGRSAVYA